MLTWHVHGNYLYYLSHIPHELWLVTDAQRSTHHSGRSGTLQWHANVHEVAVDQVRNTEFDVVLFQSRAAWEDEQHRILNPAQLRGPRIYLEHDPPQQHPTDTRHHLIDAMRRLLRDPREAQRIGEGGRRMAAERFSIDRFVSDWDAALRLVTA